MSALKVIEAPSQEEGRAMVPKVFLAGGITGCPDWQAWVLDLLADREVSLDIFNPRRPNFPIEDPNAAAEQILWEYRRLRAADAIAFWFCAETLCPIVLYELGAWSMTPRPLIVGTHPDYARRGDVMIQTSLARPDVPILDSLDALVAGIETQQLGPRP